MLKDEQAKLDKEADQRKKATEDVYAKKAKLEEKKAAKAE